MKFIVQFAALLVAFAGLVSADQVPGSLRASSSESDRELFLGDFLKLVSSIFKKDEPIMKGYPTKSLYGDWTAMKATIGTELHGVLVPLYSDTQLCSYHFQATPHELYRVEKVDKPTIIDIVKDVVETKIEVIESIVDKIVTQLEDFLIEIFDISKDLEPCHGGAYMCVSVWKTMTITYGATWIDISKDRITLDQPVIVTMADMRMTLDDISTFMRTEIGAKMVTQFTETARTGMIAYSHEAYGSKIDVSTHFITKPEIMPVKKETGFFEGAIDFFFGFFL